MKLTEFLLARIAEDEAAAEQSRDGNLDWFDSDHQMRWTPARVLAECEAKRRLIDLAFEHASTIDGEWGCCHDAETIRTGVVKADGPWEEDEPLPGRCTGPSAAVPYLAALAQPYADHPDYREEWKP